MVNRTFTNSANKSKSPPKSAAIAKAPPQNCSFCEQCGEALVDNECVCCDQCNKWFHRTCKNISPKQFKALKGKTSTWFCSAECRQAPKCSSSDIPACEFNTENPSNKDIMQAVMKVIESQNFISHQFDSQKQDIDFLKDDNMSIHQTIDSILDENKQLRNTLNKLEYETVKQDLEVRGVPYVENENLDDIFQKIATKINASIEMYKPSQVYRVLLKSHQDTGERNQTPPIIVKLASQTSRDEFINLKKSFGQLTAKDIGYSSTSQIFLGERLTSSTKHLLWMARTTKEATGYKYAWVKHGKVFMRKSDTSKPLQIAQISDVPH
ncbi:Hypothetical protein NTJ_09873 [Nesidiocoris tenuis]|uniref:PHD-type domain-containing protein n=1 Tax=Nesidiocoris tenuis TaxID=355587 RepID=A0ABN7AXZ7_9HEMI|nr:Hypothetical protein NTJ_09873 [Nesidiocoris tenuis]